MYFKSLLPIAVAALVGGISPLAFAASSFHLVIPLKVLVIEPDPVDPSVTVSLIGGALLDATLNQVYRDELRPYLREPGSVAAASEVRWQIAEGALPAGLELDSTTGVVTGLPTESIREPISFTVQASYMGAHGAAEYSIKVNEEVLRVSKVVNGQSHSCALLGSGTVKCWGDNSYGQLGDGTQLRRPTPVTVKGLSEVTSIAAGQEHTCASTTNGAVHCWGGNDKGQLGDATTTRRLLPTAVKNLSGTDEVVAGDYFTCATVSGTVRCWGANSAGQLGDDSTADYKVSPVAVKNLTAVIGISAGQSHSCTVVSGGTVKCWGANNTNQLGDRTTTTRRSPVTVSGLSAVTGIAMGQHHSCAITVTKEVKCWGLNETGQLGDGTKTKRPAPVTVSGLSDISAVAGGTQHTCAVTSLGEVKCWGANGLGVLGVASPSASSVPLSVSSLGSSVLSLSSGPSHVCAVLRTGAVRCWGNNGYGQLGDKSTTIRKTPVAVSGLD